jgi:osmotically-inducible protein OsmY
MESMSKKEEDILNAVLRRLAGLPTVKVEAAASDGAIVLAGFAEDHARKIDAESAASAVEGVHSVINRIELEPMLRREHYSARCDHFREHVRRRLLASLGADVIGPSSVGVTGPRTMGGGSH